MILDIFSELQKADGAEESSVYAEGLEQAKLADELGFGCWWSVEHHCTPNFSYCSTPDLFLTLLSQHTERIHLGSAGTLAPHAIHHPLQIAERAAFLDVVSGGRVELGLARSISREWETFGVDEDESRGQVHEALRLIPRLWTEAPFDYQGKYLSLPPRDVVPKPVQKPHPPLWLTVAHVEGFEGAGRAGVGVLATLLMAPPETLTAAFDAYQRGLDQCDPAGAFVNNQRALFAFFHCARTREEAIASGAASAALWFMNMQAEIYGIARPAWIKSIREQSVMWGVGQQDMQLATGESQPDFEFDLDDPVLAIALMNRLAVGETIDPVEAFEALEPYGAVIIGDVDSCLEKIARLEALGLDRLMCLMQMGPLSHEVVMNSIRNAGEFLIPELKRSQAAAPR
jgi:alkanesulfonate monooxygenase SsuD/methylene tetrahydromethanopterin reductase-like flavin-dependent oxidoreductase (luciferase family)